MTITNILQFVASTLLPVVVTLALHYAEQRFDLANRNHYLWQGIVGVAFGLVAIIGTEFGIVTHDATMNVRDAAPIVAGLVFGAPSGVVAGLIGGVERWFAALWGRGMFTRFACSLATILAGVYAAALRIKMFDDKRPSWTFGMAIGIVAEVVHLSLIFATNLDNVTDAYNVVRACAVPMIVANGVAVWLSLAAVSMASHEKVSLKGEDHELTDTIQAGMLGAIIFAFVITTAFSSVLQANLAESSTRSLLSLNIDDVMEDISDASDANILARARRAARQVPTVKSANHDQLVELMSVLDVSEINIVNETGCITVSTDNHLVNYNMRKGAQSREFLVLLEGSQEDYVQDYQERSFGDETWRKYAAVAIEGGFIQVGYDASQFQRELESQVSMSTLNRHVGEDGFIFVIDQDENVEGEMKELLGDEAVNVTTSYKTLRNAIDTHSKGELFEVSFYGERYYAMYDEVEGYGIIALLPLSEADFSRNVAVLVGTFMEVMVFALLFASIYFLIKDRVVNELRRVNGRLSEITHGNLDARVDVRSNVEFADLSDDINQTVDTLKHYIAEAAARIDSELEYARSIQLAALPSVFPAYPKRSDFEIFASMNAAKEVGGDFYDFYLLDEDHLAFLVADVSGKGIPGAMFMMRAKTVLRSFMETGISVAHVFSNANDQLCEGNDANMFVTAWMGVIDLTTGHVISANAGHNPPCILHASQGGGFEYLTLKRNLILGCMEGIRYRYDELDLAPGDVLFLYTDGIVEANDPDEVLFGEERLLKSLNAHTTDDMESLCEAVAADVNAFANGMPQFDDMTMLALRYIGKETSPEEVSAEEGVSITVEADVKNVARVTEFLEQQLEAMDCPMRTVIEIDVATDEVLANICNYAYRDMGIKGTATVRLHRLDGESGVRITFEDMGVAFNPLDAPEPDTTADLEHRGIGGLGIFIVRKSMDEVTYERRGDTNVLSIVKHF